MAEKVKVSREVAEAIEKAKEIRSEEVIINMCVKKLFVAELDILNTLSSYFIAQILINGYEIEETPEEKLFETHSRYWERGEMKKIAAMETTLNILGIKIKGINK